MWILLLLVVDINDAYSVSTKIQVPFSSEIECEKAAAAMTFSTKANQVKINAICKKD